MVLSTEEIEKRIADSYELPNNVLDRIPDPLVSVRTSTYNHGPYIKQCIEGVLMQKTSFPFEFIIGEDCSTDETREIVFEYAKKYPNIIRVVTADYNVGSKANGRRCINKCRGKYITLCEGDDYWTDPLKLQKQVDFLENNPEYGLCYTRAKQFNQRTQKYMPDISSPYKDVNDLILNRNPIVTLTALYRKELYYSYIKEINPTKKNWLTGDYPLWIWIGLHSKIHYMKETTAVYRYLDHSASHSIGNIKKQEDFNRSIYEIRIFYIKKYFKEQNKYIQYISDDFYRRNTFNGIMNNDRIYCLTNIKKIKFKTIRDKIYYLLFKSKIFFYFYRLNKSY